MQAPVPHQPVQPPQRGRRIADYDAARDDVEDAHPDTTAPTQQGLFGDLVPDIPRPQPDWDWATDNERRQR